MEELNNNSVYTAEGLQFECDPHLVPHVQRSDCMNYIDILNERALKSAIRRFHNYRYVIDNMTTLERQDIESNHQFMSAMLSLMDLQTVCGELRQYLIARGCLHLHDICELCNIDNMSAYLSSRGRFRNLLLKSDWLFT